MAFEMQAGAIWSELQLDNTKFVKAINEALAIAKTMGSKIEAALTGGGAAAAGAVASTAGRTANAMAASTVAVSAFERAASKVGYVFHDLMDVTGVAFMMIRAGLNSVMTPVRWVYSQFFNLKNLIAGFATVWTFRHAAEVEALAASYRGLTESIGLAGDALLRKLRVAVRNSVSDMELMRLTNQAIQFEAIQSEEQFVKLAEAAHELGEALGVGAADALEKFIYVLGTGQTRQLRSLRIFVDASEAVDKYRLATGKLAKEMTPLDERLAVSQAMMAKIDEQLGRLAGSAPLTMKGFERLGVALKNLFDQISVLVAGPFAKLSQTIADFLNNNSGRILAFVNYVMTLVKALFSQVGKVFETLAEGRSISAQLTKLSKSVGTLVSSVVKFGVTVLQIAIVAVTPVVTQALLGMLGSAFEAFMSASGPIWLEMGGWFAKRLVELRHYTLDTLTGKAVPGAERSEEQLRNERKRIELLTKLAVGMAADEGRKEALRKAAEEPNAFQDFIEVGLVNAKPVMEKAAKDLTEAFYKGLQEARGAFDFDWGTIFELNLAEFEMRTNINFARVGQKLKEALGRVQGVLAKEGERIREGFTRILGFGPARAAEEAVKGPTVKEQLEARDKFYAEREQKTSQMRQEIYEEQIREELELQKVGLTELDARIAEIDSTRKKRIQEVKQFQDVNLLAAIEQRAESARIMAAEAEKRRVTAALSTGITDGIVRGLADGFAKGERLSKTAANIWASIWQNSMNRAIEQTVNYLSSLLSTALAKVGAAIGLGAGIGGFATGLIAIGGAIWSHFAARKEATIEDFNTAINSSEAVRGVVAGPTNVAISKVGESLKGALRTTEMLLERIARDIEQGGGAPAGGGAGPRNMTLALTGSTV